MAKLTLVAVQNLISEQTKVLTDEIGKLRNEVVQLRTELAAVKKCALEQKPNNTSIAQQTPSMEEAVSASVKTALQDEKTKCEVVLVQLPENKRDTKDIEEMCHRLQIKTRPSALTRMGESSTANKPRPLKVTFPTQFDARLFLAKVDENNHNRENPAVRCRLCRSRHEQARYAALRPQVKILNDTARENGIYESFSIRQNGDVWRFTKQDGKWKRDVNWKLAPSPAHESQPQSDSTSGNDSPTPLD